VSYSEQNIEVWFASEPSDTVKTEITDKYHSLTSSDNIPYSEILKAFSKSKIDGENYFYNFAAEHFAIKEAAGELTIENINYIFNRLNPVINKLVFGFWGISLVSMQCFRFYKLFKPINEGLYFITISCFFKCYVLPYRMALFFNNF